MITDLSFINNKETTLNDRTRVIPSIINDNAKEEIQALQNEIQELNEEKEIIKNSLRTILMSYGVQVNKNVSIDNYPSIIDEALQSLTYSLKCIDKESGKTKVFSGITIKNLG